MGWEALELREAASLAAERLTGGAETLQPTGSLQIGKPDAQRLT